MAERYATVSRRASGDRGADQRSVEALLPSQYRVLATWPQGASTVALVAGHDVAGWTMDAYVLPRLASGGWYGHEVDASTARGVR